MARMAKLGTMPLAVEGEISSDSLEEISEGDFKHQKSPRRPSVRARMGSMGDEQQYPILQGNHASNLYNFACARAVQNKPLATFILEKATPEVKPASGRSDAKDSACASVRQVVCYMVDSSESNGPTEKEEELEEGEVNSGSSEMEVVDEVASCVSEITDEKVAASDGAPFPPAAAAEEVVSLHSEEDSEIELAEDIDAQVASILEELETISGEDAEK